MSSGQRQRQRGATGIEFTEITDGSWVVMQRMLNCVSRAQKALEKSQKLKGDYQVCIHLDQMVLVVVRQGGWTA